MIRWGAPQMLYWLLAVPALVAILIAAEWLKRRSLRRLADGPLVARLTDSRSPRWAALKAICLLLGLALLILASARPQWGEKLQVYRGRGIDIVIALDASRSMLATDVRPNRLSRAKTEIAALLDHLSTNRVGIVAFAGDAQVMCPLTTDVDAAKLFLDIIDPDNMPRPGTNVQRAVEVAASLLEPMEETSKALVLVTDGESLEGDPGAATRLAAQNGIRVFAVGVGTPEGSTIPEAGVSGTSYKKDQDDKVVVSRLAERLLLVMAKATDGRYFRSEGIRLDDLVAALDQVQKKAIGGGDFVEYEERYQAFLLAAFLLLVAGTLVSDRRGGWFRDLRLPAWPVPARRGVRDEAKGATKGAMPHAAWLLASLLLAGPPARADIGSTMRRGNSLERQGKVEEAIKAYEQALVERPDDVRIHYNIGRALSRANQQEQAIEHFQLGVLSKQKPLRAKSLYNLGNCQFRQQRLDEAIAMYSQALLVRPDDLQAKQNLEYCWKLKAEQRQQPDSSRTQPRPQPQPQPQAQPQAREQPGAISRDQADRMLQALQSKEREKLKQQPPKPQGRPAGGKDW